MTTPVVLPPVGTGLLLPAQFGADDAVRVVGRRLPHAELLAIGPTHHEYAGFAHRVDFGRGPAAKAGHLVHSLVDRSTGTALIAPPLDEVAVTASRPDGPITGDRVVLGLAEAERSARRTVETATMRRSRLGRAFELELVSIFEAVWKPNWLVTVALRGRRMRVLVDGLSGEHWSG